MELNKYLTQEPRPSCFFHSDVEEAVDKVNWMALEHAGKDNDRYKSFLLAVSKKIIEYSNYD